MGRTLTDSELIERLTEEQIAEWKEAFQLFDTEGEGYVDSSEMGTIFRLIGQNPTQEEVRKYIHEVERFGKEHNDRIQFPEFLLLVARKQKTPDSSEAIINAFRTFDKQGNGFVAAAEVRHILTTVGEVFNDEEIGCMLSEARVDVGGMFNYQEFVLKMNGEEEEHV